MRVYKFLSSHFALKSLSEKRLKISRFDDLNDPFDLIPYNLGNPGERWALQASRSQLGQNNGMLCFSATWRDPVLWAHYADKHKGICIGFELSPNLCKKVTYVSKRLPFPPSLALTNKVSQVILYTKFKHWAYEQEVRSYVTLKDAEGDGLFYFNFGHDLKPFSVIAGARCVTTKQEIIRALGELSESVQLIKARPGFKKFEIVKNLQGFKTTPI